MSPQTPTPFSSTCSIGLKTKLSSSMPNASNRLARLHSRCFPSGEGKGSWIRQIWLHGHTNCVSDFTYLELPWNKKNSKDFFDCRWGKDWEALSSGLAHRKAPGKSQACGRLAKHFQHITTTIFSISAVIYCMDWSIFVRVFMHTVACVIVAMWRSGGNCRESVLSFTTWTPRPELRPSGLAASACPSWAILAALQLPVKPAQCPTSTPSVLLNRWHKIFKAWASLFLRVRHPTAQLI